MKKIFKDILITLCFIIVGYILGLFEIPLMNNRLIIRFTYIVTMLYAMHFNSYWCAGFAIILDLLPFAISPPSYSFFPGYTISEVLRILIYRNFLYRKDTNFADILLCRICVNTLINILLGAIWIYILYGSASSFGWSLLKNLLLAPVEAGVFYLIYIVIGRQPKVKEIIYKIFGE